MAASDVKHRVIRLPETLREAIRTARDANGWTNAQFVGKSVEQHLEKVLESLQALGFGSFEGPTRPMRLPFDDQYGTLDLLREASETVHLPSTQLLALCFIAAAKEAPKPTEEAPKPTEEPDETSKPTTRRRKTTDKPKQTKTRKPKEAEPTPEPTETQE